MARHPKSSTALVWAVSALAGRPVQHDGTKRSDPDPEGDLILGEDVTWWAAVSRTTAKALRRAFRDHDVPGVMYERSGSIVDLGKLGDEEHVIALQLVDPAGDIAEDWPLDVALEELAIRLIAPVSRILAGYNPLVNHGPQAQHVVQTVQERIHMPAAPVKSAAPKAAAKPATAAPKATPAATAKPAATAAPKAAAATAKPAATPAAPKTAPAAPAAAAKPATPAAPKAATPGAPKATPASAPKPSPAPAAAPAGDALAKALERIATLEAKFKAFDEGDLPTVIGNIDQRLGNLEYLIRFGEGATYGDDGAIVLDFSVWRSPEALRSWAWLFHSEELALGDIETIIATLTAQMGAEGGIQVVNEGDLPESVVQLIQTEVEAGGDEPPAEEEQPTLTAEMIDGMDAATIKATAAQMEVDFSDMPKFQIKVARERLKLKLAELQAGETAEEVAEGFGEGEEVNVTAEDGSVYPATVKSGPDEAGNYIVTWDVNGEDAETAAETISSRLGRRRTRPAAPRGPSRAPFLFGD